MPDPDVQNPAPPTPGRSSSDSSGRLSPYTVPGTIVFLTLLISAVIFLVIATTAEPDQTVGTSESVRAGLVESGPSVAFRLAIISLVTSVIGLIAIITWRLATTQNGTTVSSANVSSPKRDERGRSIVETLFMMAGGLSAIQLLVIAAVRASPRADSPINQRGTGQLLAVTGFLCPVMVLGVYAFYASTTRDKARRSAANEPATNNQVEPGQPGSAA